MHHQTTFLLQALHGHHVGDQQHVRLRRTGFEFGQQLRHDLGGAVTDPLDLNARMRRGEGIDGCLGVGVRLGGVEHELAGNIFGVSGGGCRGQEAGCDQKLFHVTDPLHRAAKGLRMKIAYQLYMTVLFRLRVFLRLILPAKFSYGRRLRQPASPLETPALRCFRGQT